MLLGGKAHLVGVERLAALATLGAHRCVGLEGKRPGLRQMMPRLGSLSTTFVGVT